jgi:membrane protease YdiL (CAAX protease family)
MPIIPNLTYSSDPRDSIAWGPGDVLLALAIAVAGLIFSSVVVFMVAVAVMGVSTDLSSNDPQVIGISLVLTLALDAMFFAIAAALSVGKYHLSWRALGFRGLSLERAWFPAVTLVAIVVAVIGYSLIVEALGLDKLIPESTIDNAVADNTALTVLAGVLAVLVAPIVEETFFRGFIFSGLARRFGFLGAALLSGLLFSLAHAQVGTILPFTLVGMALAWGYAASGSLWTAISAHFVWNAISFSLLIATN